MRTRNTILAVIGIPGFFALGAIAASAAGAGTTGATQAPGAALTSLLGDRSGGQLLLSNTTAANSSGSPQPAASGDPHAAGRCHDGGAGRGLHVLDALVTDGTITADQKTRIIAAFHAKEAAETDADEAAEHADRPAWVSSVLDPLVQDGTITSDQAAKVKTALVDAFAHHGNGNGGPGRGAFLGSALDTLVTDGTITAEQRTKVVAAFKAAGRPARPADGTKPDHVAFITGVVDGLVTDGTLSRSAADKVQTALVAVDAVWGPGGPGHRGHRGPRARHDDGGTSPAAPAPSDAPAEGSSSNG